VKRHYQNKVTHQVPRINGELVGSKNIQPRKYNFIDETNEMISGFYCSVTIDIIFTDLLESFQPTHQIMAIGAFSISMENAQIEN